MTIRDESQPPIHARERNLSISEAAGVLGVSRRTIYRMAQSGQIKTTRIMRRRLVSSSEIQRILKHGCD